MRKFPHYWKRLVRRAVAHETAQLKIKELVHKKHSDMAMMLRSTGFLNPGVQPPSTEATQFAEDECYGCMLCQQAQKTRAGEAVHMNRRHGRHSMLRHLYNGSSCPGCLKEFHVPERVHQHLRSAKTCRDYLDAYGWSADLAPGKGTKEHGDYELAHDGLLPFQQALGPLHEAPAHRVEQHIDESLLEEIIDHLDSHQFMDELVPGLLVVSCAYVVNESFEHTFDT